MLRFTDFLFFFLSLSHSILSVKNFIWNIAQAQPWRKKVAEYWEILASIMRAGSASLPEFYTPSWTDEGVSWLPPTHALYGMRIAETTGMLELTRNLCSKMLFMLLPIEWDIECSWKHLQRWLNTDI